MAKWYIRKKFSNNRNKTDPAGNVRAYSTAYFSFRNDQNGLRHVKVTSGNGGWTILQSGVTVNNRKITYGTVGLSRFGSATSAKQRVTKTGLGSSWSFSTPASWVHVYNGTVGVTSNAKLGGRSTANLQLINNWTF